MHYNLTTRYDESAYKALSDASWQLFQEPKMRSTGYPMIIMIAILTAVSIFIYKDEFGVMGMVLGSFLVLVSISAIPLSKINGKKKLFKASLKAANKVGEFPAQVRIRFLNKGIKSSVNDRTSEMVPYSDVVVTALLDQWCFIYFDKGAYIVNQSSFCSDGEFEIFKNFIQEKTQKDLVQL